jgi:hypothetical protein
MAAVVARTDNSAMRLLFPIMLALVLVPSALSAEPRTQTISGTVSANAGSWITVSSSDRSLTCIVLGTKAQAAIARWGVGAKAAMACRQDGDRLLLSRLTRLGAKEGSGSNDGPATTTTTTTTTATTTPPATIPAPTPAAPANPERREARGVVTALSGDGVTVKPDAGGDAIRCRITRATDSTAAAAKLSLGAHVGIVCRRDGDGYVLSGATPIN